MGKGVGLTGAILRGIAMRKNYFVLLFVVLALGVYSPSAKALGFVDVLYNVSLDTTFLGGPANKVAAPLTGSMTIRYDHAGTGTGTTIASGGAQMMSLNASGPVVLFVGGILSMTGTAWLTMGTATQIGTWGSLSFPASYTSITKTSGLKLPGLNGLMTAAANCSNLGAALQCTNIAGMPTATNPHSLPIPFVGKQIIGYGNFNTAGPPTTLSFLGLATVADPAGPVPLSHNLASTLINLAVPMSMWNVVGVEVSRTFVPEPNTALLLGGGIIGLACFGSTRRRKR